MRTHSARLALRVLLVPLLLAPSRADAGFSYEFLIAASLARLGRDEAARAAADAHRARLPQATLGPVRLFIADEVVDYLLEGLRLAGLEVQEAGADEAPEPGWLARSRSLLR